MALPREYVDEDCAVARSLEIIGERWTLLIVRDAFYGVRRFSDFRDHLRIPRAVLTDRLRLLVDHGILDRSGATGEYWLTAKGEGLWPAVWSLMSWGNEHYVPARRQRPFTHAGCGGTVGANGVCASCRAVPPARELTVHPRPAKSPIVKDNPVSRALSVPHQLLTPIDTTSR